MHYFLKHAEKKPLETIAEVSSEDESDQYSECFECSTSTNLRIKQNNNKSLYDKLYLVKDDLPELVNQWKTMVNFWNTNLLFKMCTLIPHLMLCSVEIIITHCLTPKWKKNNKGLHYKPYLVRDDLLKRFDQWKTMLNFWNTNLLFKMCVLIPHLILCLAEKFIKSLLPPPKPLQLHARTPQHTLK